MISTEHTMGNMRPITPLCKLLKLYAVNHLPLLIKRLVGLSHGPCIQSHGSIDDTKQPLSFTMASETFTLQGDWVAITAVTRAGCDLEWFKAMPQRHKTISQTCASSFRCTGLPAFLYVDVKFDIRAPYLNVKRLNLTIHLLKIKALSN
jgi:hypothetical protein